MHVYAHIWHPEIPKNEKQHLMNVTHKLPSHEEKALQKPERNYSDLQKRI